MIAPVTVPSVLGASVGIMGFVAALFIGSMIVPGRDLAGVVREGRCVVYRFNGLALFGLTLAFAASAQAAGYGLDGLARHVWSLLVAANIFAWTTAFVLLLASPKRQRSLALFLAGSERDPALLGVDLKIFSYRPSLIGLALLNLSFAALQWRTSGRLSAAMVTYEAMTLLYIANYFQFEHGMIYTWDIVEEHFGWMLVWGDYVLVPFFYCLPAYFVMTRPDQASTATVVVAILLYGFGYWMFRGANQQKHRFKCRPEASIWGRPPRLVGGRLLASGFWGIGRKLNYTGEILVYVAWTLMAGFHSLIPYALPLWLLGLLAQRAARDDERCRAKYGATWDLYCAAVPFRMFPLIY